MQRSYGGSTAKSSTSTSTELNALFETCLAITLLQKRILFPVVDKISNAIIKMLTSERQKIIDALNDKESDNLKNLQDDLYTKQLGFLNRKKTKPDDILDDILAVLRNHNGQLVNIIPIHIAVSQSILPLLDNKTYSETLAGFHAARLQIDAKKEFITQAEKAKSPTTKLGIIRPAHYFATIDSMAHTANIKASSRITAMEQYVIDPNSRSPLAKKFYKNHAPIVGGPCTDMLTLMVAMKLYEKQLGSAFTPRDIREYALANFAYQTTAGQHSFHEVMLVATKCLDRHYNLTSYTNKIPYMIRRCDFMRELKRRFPVQLKTPMKSEKKPEAPSVIITPTAEPVASVTAPKDKSVWQKKALIYGAGAFLFFGTAVAVTLRSSEPSSSAPAPRKS